MYKACNATPIIKVRDGHPVYDVQRLNGHGDDANSMGFVSKAEDLRREVPCVGHGVDDQVHCSHTIARNRVRSSASWASPSCSYPEGAREQDEEHEKNEAERRKSRCAHVLPNVNWTYLSKITFQRFFAA
jgi:hypothetical protein